MRIVSLGEVLRAFFFFQARLISSTRNFVRFRIEIYISKRGREKWGVSRTLFEFFPPRSIPLVFALYKKKREREIQIISSLIHHFPRIGIKATYPYPIHFYFPQISPSRLPSSPRFLNSRIPP